MPADPQAEGAEWFHLRSRSRVPHHKWSNYSLEQDLNNEVAALKTFGVNIAENHDEGYGFHGVRPAHHPASKLPPWERGVLEELGPSKAMQCDVDQTWNNDELLFEIREGIAYCTLNRPAANNSLNSGISNGLHDAARILRGRLDIDIVVLTGNGRMFCTGGDPKSFQTSTAEAGEGEGEEVVRCPSAAEILDLSEKASGLRPVDMFARDLAEWASLPQFTICCLNGTAMGSGVGLACVCDMVVAVKTAHCHFSEVKLGYVPAVISPYVVRAIGASHAKRLFISGETCNMQMALDIGLVQRVVNDTSEFPKVLKELAQKVQSIAPKAIGRTKEALLNCLDQPMTEPMMQYTADYYAKVRLTEECQGTMKMLVAKKRPEWMTRPIAVKEEHGMYFPDGPLPPVTLTQEQAIQMEDELVKMYDTPDFQKKLRDAFEAAGDDRIKQGRARQDVCLEIQKPILKKFGFEPSKRGVAMSVSSFTPYNIVPEIAERNALLGWLVNPTTQMLMPRPELTT